MNRRVGEGTTRLSLPLATAAILAIALVGTLMMAGGGGVGRAQVNGDLLLDWAIDDNTPTSVGVVDTECQSFSAGTVIQIDVIAVSANDWAGMDFVIEYPSPAVVSAPGRDDGQEGGAFDFAMLDLGNLANTAGSQNFLFPDSSDSNADYSTTEVAPDGSSPHGISMFDNSLAGNSGSGAMARITLDNTADLAPGVYTISLGVTGAFAGGVHSNASLLTLDNLGSVQLAIDTDCAAGPPPTPTPGAAATGAPDGLPPTGSSDTDGDDWLIVVYVVGGLIVALAALGVIYWRLRRRPTNR